MAYSDFKNLEDIRRRLEVQIVSRGPLFPDVVSVPASAQLGSMLEENVPLALNINTEKARSELIIAPVLLEVRRLLDRQISLFSGIDFPVDEALSLTGYCDFLLSRSPDQVFLEVPVVCIVEAKNENIKSGYAQCIAEMLAANIFNERQGHPVPGILGVVTTGSNWKFLQLEEQTVFIDFDEYLISQVEKILGIFVVTLQRLTAAHEPPQNRRA